MTLTDIVKNSFKYPLDVPKWAILSVLVIIGNLVIVLPFLFLIEEMNNEILSLISIIVSIFVLGYGISILRSSIDKSDNMPDFNIKNNFADGLKHIVVSFVYLIIPFLIFIALSYLMNITAYNFDLVTYSFTKTTLLNQTADSIYTVTETAAPTLNIIITLIISFVISLVFALFEIIGLCRLAKFNSLKEAFNFKVIVGELKQKGLKLFAGIIVIFLISFILSAVFAAFNLFSWGIIISLIGYAYLFIFHYRFIGLLYGE